MNHSTEPSIKNIAYRGRFAPSPTGVLHFGSLVAALASYLDAKAHGGEWLVRMEDLDPPREEAGAADSILRSLEAHHLYWDHSVLYQSQRLQAYQAALDQLRPFIYPCSCTRQRIIDLAGCYDGHCRRHPPNKTDLTALRLMVDQLPLEQQTQAEIFDDCILGPQKFPLATTGDFIIRRKDRLFAYQLAVATDDIFQNITHVIRGHDLIDSTSRQRYIVLLLKPDHLPYYGHTPLALGEDGDKLSKQTKAPPIDNNKAPANLIAALTFLNHPPPLKDLAKQDCKSLLQWAINSWQRDKLPKHSAVAPPFTDA